MRGPLAGNLPWMTWNLLLAAVPAALAVGLFRALVRRTPLWWLGLATFAAFLPNAAYVLTDVVHLPGDLRAASGWSRGVTLALLAQYGLLFAVGFAAYAVSVVRAERWLRGLGWSRRAVVAVDVAVHLACAVGVFLGRVWRFNSWDLVHRPDDVLDVVLGGLANPRPFTVSAVLLSATVLAVGTMVLRLLATVDWRRTLPS